MRRKTLLTLTMAGWIAGAAQAQIAGLPVADTAARGMIGDMTVSGGLVLGDDLNLYGGRGGFHVLNELSIFGDFGIVDPDRGDAGFGLQAGSLFTLPPIPDLLVDFGLRGTIGYANLDQRFNGEKVGVDITTVTAGGVASMAVDEILSVYGFLGLAYIRTSASGFSGSDTEPALGIGALVDFAPDLSVYAEAMHVDDLWIGMGLRWRFNM